MKITKQKLIREANLILEECRSLRSLTDMERLRLRKIKITISSKMTRCAGKAQPNTGEVKISLPFFSDPKNFESNFRNTVTHEIAHVLAPPTSKWGSKKRSVHGHAWRNMHKRLGGNGETYHNMSLPEGFERKQRTELPCGCGCGKMMKLGPVQYKRQAAGKASYRLKECCR